jgi:hypothetical protein
LVTFGSDKLVLNDFSWSRNCNGLQRKVWSGLWNKGFQPLASPEQKSKVLKPPCFSLG